MGACKHCRNGFLDNRFGQDVECVNGVLIDIDVYTEGWARDTLLPVAPCHPDWLKQCRDEDFDNDSLERLEATVFLSSEAPSPQSEPKASASAQATDHIKSESPDMETLTPANHVAMILTRVKHHELTVLEALPRVMSAAQRDLEAECEALKGERDDALRLMTQYAREAGEAKGRLEMSEAAGIVDGWRERATRAEGENERLQRALRPITMQDVRLAIGEGNITPIDVLYGCNAEIRRRAALQEPRS